MSRGLLVFMIGLLSSYVSEELIFWHTDELRWEHFKTKENNNKGFDALVASGIQVSTKDSAGHITIDLKSYMDPSESWVLRGSKTQRLLNHERRHFDITEISRRRLSLALQTEPRIHSDNLNIKVDSLFDVAMKWQSNMSDTYDSSTNHGLSISQQISWDIKIDNMLEEYKALEATRVQMW